MRENNTGQASISGNRKGLLYLAKKALREPWKLSQAMCIELSTLRILFAYGLPDVLLQLHGGIGDNLLLTVVAHELKKRNESLKIWQVSPAADLLQGNPDYNQVFSLRHAALSHSNLLNSRRVLPDYNDWIIKPEIAMPPKRHIIAELCSSVGITGKISLRPYVYLTKEEKAKGSLMSKQVVFQCVGADFYSSGTYGFVGRLKLWYPDRFQAVADKIRELRKGSRRLEIIQLGDKNDPRIEGALDLRGRTTLRESAAILSQSCLFVGTVGFLAHLARAVECRSVIIFGGKEHAFQSGYECNENIETHRACAPCWGQKPCDFGHNCMKMITTDAVVDAVKRGLARIGEPLIEEKVSL
jgi:ADP-heptose:LPS heptosyltransferase